MKILVLHGPNLNWLGKRDIKHYGRLTLEQINHLIRQEAKSLKIQIAIFQSNHEGSHIDFLQRNSATAQGILINPGALTHYGYSLRDALEDAKLPVVSVHLSDLKNRESFRKIDVYKDIVLANISGLKEKSYLKGLKILKEYLCESK